MDGQGLKDLVVGCFVSPDGGSARWGRPMTRQEMARKLEHTYNSSVVGAAVRQLVDEGRLAWRYGYQLGEWTWPGRRDHAVYHVPPPILQRRWEQAAAQAPWILHDAVHGPVGRFATEDEAQAAAVKAGAGLRSRTAWRAAKADPERGRVLEHFHPDRVWRPLAWVYEDGEG